MNVTQLPNGSNTEIPAFITDAPGDGISGLTPTFVLKCLSSTDANNVDKFYNFTANAWQVSAFENAIPEVADIPGMYVFQFDQSAIGVDNDVYAARVNTTTTITTDFGFLFKYGGSLEASLNKLLSVIAPYREELHRITNNSVEMVYFNEDDVEVSRFRVTHDPSGAQPEQTKEEV